MFRMNEYLYSIFFVAVALDLILRRVRPPLRVFARENPILAAGGSKPSIEEVYE
jgi:hypothetical protein